MSQRTERLLGTAKRIYGSPLLLPGLLVAGAILRIARYVVNPSLWLDEAMLANNIVTRDYGRLLERLDDLQAAPIGFLFAERFAVDLFGNHEYALRLVALLAGLAALVLFYVYVRRRLSRDAQLFALALFVFSGPLLRYAAEVKQYGLDVFCAMLMLVLVPHRPGLGGARAVALAGAGMAAVWFSHPVIFVLAGLGSTGFGAALIGRAWREAAGWAVVGALWVASFAGNFFWVTHQTSGSESFASYWSGSFIPFPPGSVQDVRWLYNELPDFINSTEQFTATGIAAFLLLYGAAAVHRSDRRHFYLLATPIAFTVLGSMLGLYPFTGRFVLFLFPVGFVFIALGGAQLAERIARHAPVALALVIGLLLFHPVERAVYGLVRPPYATGNREAVAYIAAHAQPGDAVFLTLHGSPTYDYYERVMDLPELDVARESESELFGLALEDLGIFFGRDRVWVVLGHVFPGNGQFRDTALTAYFDLVSPGYERVPFREAAVYLVDLSDVP